jgi:HEAT repeat protein
MTSLPTRLRLASLALATLASAQGLAAQSLANRVSGAPDGPVQFTFAARPGVCGNGSTYISTGPDSFTGTFNGTITEIVRRDPCQPGPVRVVLSRADRSVVEIDTYVGTPRVAPGAADLGSVPAREAADYLLSLAARLDGKPARDAIFPAALADSAVISPALLAIARDQSRSREARRSALSYLGRDLGERGGMEPSRVASALAAIARDETDNQTVRQQALSVLARLERADGVPALIELSRGGGDVWLARETMRALARSGDPRARQYLRVAVKRADISEDARVAAIRGIGQEYATSADAEFLRGLYASLGTDASREAVMTTLAELGGRENVAWLMSVARSGDASTRLRRRALQSASKAGATTAELVSLYDATTDAEMRTALLSLYQERGDRAATDKLVSIARTDADQAMRRRAISHLSRSEDPRVKEALRSIVER